MAAITKWTVYWNFRNERYDSSIELLQSFDKGDAGIEVKVKEVAGWYGDTLLHIACQNGWLDIVKRLIEKYGCDPKVKDRGKQIPLHYACHYGRLDTVQYLVRVQSCDINAITSDQWTPFYYACCYGHLNVVEYLANIPGITSHINQQVLLELVCEYGHTDTLLYLINEQGIIPKNTPRLLCIAYKHGYLEIALNLCNHLENFQNMDLEKHRALFIFCCSNNRLDVLKQLSLDCRGANTSQFLELSNLGLHYACQEGHIDVVKYLVEECGCDINVRNKDGLTPLHLACKYGNSVEVVQYLLGRSECNSLARANNGNTSVHFACTTTQFNPDIVKILVKHGANMTKGTLSLIGDRSILNDVAKPAILSALLKVSKCDPNMSNYAGVSPIQLATYPFIARETIARHAEVELFKWITECNDEDRAIIKVQEYVDTENQLDLTQLTASNGDTILHVACVANRVSIVEYLIHSQKFDPNVRNNAGETPLHWALKHYTYHNLSSNFETDLSNLVYTYNTWKWKLSLADVDDDGNNILHLVCQINQLHLIPLLLPRANHPFLLAKNNDGYTPFELISNPKRIVTVHGLMTCSLVQDYTFKPGSIQQFIWFCKNIDSRRLESLINKHIIKWEHKRANDCCIRCLILHIPNHPSMCVLLETCLHHEEACTKTLPEKEFNISDEYTNCCVTDLVDSLIDSSLEDYTCNEELLHVACKQNKYHFVNYLLSTAKCDPNYCYNGVTPLFLTTNPDIMQILIQNGAKIQTEDIERLFSVMTKEQPIHQETLSVLLNGKQWDPNSSCNSKGDTALHLLARHHRPEIAHFLLIEAKCDPNIKNVDGETPLYLLMSRWISESEIISTIKDLMATKQWNPNSSCNSKGDTALHLSVRHHMPVVVHYLLSEVKCDPNTENLSKETPLQLATDTNIVIDLIYYGSNPDNVYKLYGKSVGLKRPLVPPVKVFIIGNSGVGKSTLTEALKIEASFLKRAFTIKRRVSDVDEKTAGIVPHDFKSKNYGHVTFYDFAGHREFYSSHAAFLHNVIQGSSPIFLLVVNLSTKNDIIQQNILYWLLFIENQCSVVNCISHVIVVGSHADVVLNSGDDPQQKAMEISESIKKMFESSIVKYVDVYPMDCQYPESPGMTKLRNCLIEICNSVRIPKVIPFNAHCFHVFLLDKFRTSIAITVQEIQNQIKKEQNMNLGITKFLPDTSAAICKMCDELNNRGHILFLNNVNSIKDSWVIIDKAILLSEVTGTIFAPKNFKQHCQLAESTGVVPLSKLIEHFPNIKTEVLIGFMTHLEFCREILDRELLELITKHHESLDTFTLLESERYFLFPGLITQEVPDNLGEENHEFKYHCGWILQCTTPDQFFSSRLLQVLILRLAFSFALVKIEVNETIPAFQRECSIWKNGIFWGEIFGMETIVEIHSSNKTVILQIRCREENLLHCFAQRSHIIRRILQCVQDFCPQIKTVDSFIHPSEATTFPIKLTSEMPQFNVQKIAEAIVKFGDCCSLSVVSAKRTILLDTLVTFEPYAEIGSSMLRSLHSDENNFGNKFSNQALEMLSLKLSRKANFFIEIFKKSYLLSSVPVGEELLTVLKQWRDGCEGTYKCLKEKLDQYSIFAGRNILELAKVPLQIQDDESDRSDTNNDDSEMPTRTEHATMPGATADISNITDLTDKPLQELPDYNNLHEDRVSSLPTYESATRLHTVPTGLSSTADEGAMDNKFLQVLPGYDEIDNEDKAAAELSLPPYETASKSNTTNTTNTTQHNEHNTTDATQQHTTQQTQHNEHNTSVIPSASTCLCSSATPKLHQLDCLEENGKKVKLIDATAAFWDKVAIRLHFEGRDIARIARDHHQQSVLAATTAFIEWLDGKGRQPPSWAVLIKALKETELFTDIVNNLECILGISDDFIAHNKPQEAVVSSCTSSVLSQPQCNGNNSLVSIATKPKIKVAKGDSGEQAEMKLERRSNLPQPDHKPKLSELKELNGHGGRKVKVIEGVGDRWKELAKSLDFDGPRIDSIDMEVPREQPDQVCQQMLTEWLDGDDDLRDPVTWETLIQCLRDAGIMDVADRLNEFINS